MRLPNPGELFAERYAILSVIGEGGFARVLRARDEKVGRDVALKITSPADGEYSAQIAQRFLREAAVIAELQDPHTITLYDFGASESGLLYMAFEFVDGRDLSRVLTNGALEPSVAVHVLKQLLSSLREAHSLGVLHRDIKPPNVMIYAYADDPFRAKLLDFGIAKPITPTAPKLTKTGAVIGTPRYMAPEQVFGEPLTAATDIYSLGLITFEMLTGRRANDADSQREILKNAVSKEAFRLPEGAAPAGLRRVVARMIAREPQDRFQSADEVQQALRDWRSDVSTPSPRAGRATEDELPATASLPPRYAERRPVASMMVAALAVVVVLAAAALFWSRGRGEPGVAAQRPQRVPVRLIEADRTPVDVPDAEDGADALTAVDSGCTGKRPIELGMGTLRRLRGLAQEEVTVYVPPDYVPTQRHGLIVLYHDSDQRPRRALEVLDHESITDLEQFVVIAPQAGRASLFAWTNAEWSKSLNVVDLAQDALCIDPERVFVIGHGSGSAAALHAMCDDSVAAVATTSHMFSPSELRNCEPSEPKPFLLVSAADDPRGPLNGGKNCLGNTVLSLGDSRDQFRKQHSCDDDEMRWSEQAPNSCVTWGCATPFVSCVAPGGRAWKGDPRTFFPGCESTASTFPHTRTIWQFFSKQGDPP